MKTVNITELRKHLPEFVGKAERGETIRITSHGKVVACLKADKDNAENARQRLKKIRGTVIKGDIESPVDLQWNADEDNL